MYRTFKIFVAMLLVFVSLIFVGCASDEEKYLSLKDEVTKLNKEFSSIENEFKIFGYNSEKEGLELFKNYEKHIEKNQKVVEKMESYLPKIKEKLDKMEPLAKKKLELKADFDRFKQLNYDFNKSSIEDKRKRLEKYKKDLTNPKSYYTAVKKTGFTELPKRRFGDGIE